MLLEANRPFQYSRFDPKIDTFYYTSHFPYDW